MDAKLHGQRFQARVTPQHNSLIAKDEPIPAERRNKTPNLYAVAVRWYVCTSAPSRELSAAAGIKRAMLRGARADENPFIPYVPCEYLWRRSVRSNLRVPRREQQQPAMRSYLFLGVLGGLCDVTLAGLRERDIDGRNLHGLTGILGSANRGPLAMNPVGLRWLRQWGEDELAGRTNLTPLAGIQVGEEVRAGSGLFNVFVGKFAGTAEGGAVGVISLEVMRALRLPAAD